MKKIIILLLSLPLGFIFYVITNILLADLIEVTGLNKYEQFTETNWLLSDIHLAISFITVYIILSKILSARKYWIYLWIANWSEGWISSWSSTAVNLSSSFSILPLLIL